MLVISYLAAGVNGSMQLGTFVQVRAALFRYDVISFLKFITVFLIIIVTLSNFNLKILFYTTFLVSLLSLFFLAAVLVISYLAAGVNGSMQLGTFVQVRAALFRYDVISFLKFITIFLIIIVTLSNFNLKILLIFNLRIMLSLLMRR